MPIWLSTSRFAPSSDMLRTRQSIPEPSSEIVPAFRMGWRWVPRFSSRPGILPSSLNYFLEILQLGDDPKFVAVDDAEVVGDSIAEVVPVLGNRVFQEFQNRSLELPEGFVVPVMGRVLVHESPTLFDRIEMGTIWRDEVQHGFSVVLF